MQRWRRERLGAVLALLCCAGAVAAPAGYDRDQALATSQAAIGRSIGDHRFLTAAGGELRLSDLGGRPLVVSLIFTSCYHVCPTITRRLADAVDVAGRALGEESFTVVSIGFDSANDSPERMRVWAAEHGIERANWRVLSADAATIERLTGELGFLFFPSPRGFDHLTQVTVLDADRRVYQHIYGDDFAPPALVEPLKRLALGLAAEQRGLAALLERVRLLCTVYDPASERYHFDYSLVVAFATGLTCLAGIALFLVRAWREHARRDASA